MGDHTSDRYGLYRGDNVCRRLLRLDTGTLGGSLNHDYVITERVQCGCYELLNIISKHIGKSIPQDANLVIKQMRDGTVTDVTVTWDTPKDRLEVDGDPS